MYFIKNRGLKFKFSLTSACILLIIFSISSYIRIQQTTKLQKDSLISRSETFAELATKPLGDAYTTYNNSGILKLYETFTNTLQHNDNVSKIQIISVNGKVLFDTDILTRSTADTLEVKNESIISDSKLIEAISSNTPTRIFNNQGDLTEIIVPYSDTFGSRPFSFRYFVSYELINENIRQAILMTVILNIIIFLSTLVTITLLVNTAILNPLTKITKVAHAIENGDLKQNIEVKTHDELENLAVSLNHMTTKLKENIFELKKTDQMKDEFITIASHNLRTPLTIIKGYIPILKEKNADDDSKNILDTVEKSVQKLDTITESLLNIVSFEKNKQPLTKAEHNVVDIIKNEIEKVKTLIEQRQLKLNVNLPDEPVQILLDKTRIGQAIHIVIDNAIKFNKPKGFMTIDLTTLENEIIISVSDTGIGISAENLQNIFQRFHRGSDILTYDYEGIGLGLYLCKMIIEAHEGTIHITSTQGEGTTVSISLPKI